MGRNARRREPTVLGAAAGCAAQGAAGHTRDAALGLELAVDAFNALGAEQLNVRASVSIAEPESVEALNDFIKVLLMAHAKGVEQVRCAVLQRAAVERAAGRVEVADALVASVSMSSLDPEADWSGVGPGRDDGPTQRH